MRLPCYDWLKKYLELPNGIPSHDTWNRVFSLINEKELEKTFIQWVSNIKIKYDLEIIAIDGKTIRGSKNTNETQSKIHLVSAWACENDLVLGQVKVQKKSNEIIAIPELLDSLDIKNTVITIDAMGTQKKIAKKIVESKADYILSLKRNHKNLYEDISYYFEKELKEKSNFFSSCKTKEKNHGRIETRECYVCNDIEWLKDKEKWENFKSIIMIKSQREINGKCSFETKFYISSLDKSAEFHLNSIRKHWKIENSLHWVLDVGFNEDHSRIRAGNSSENMAIVRKVSLNLLKKEKTLKGGIEKKRKKAGWDLNYLAKVIFG